MSLVTKAIFPVAGLGTRFLPATKANPKEMLPIVDKPLIQYAVEEAIQAGITQLIFVTSVTKRAIEDHFDRSILLEQSLKASDKCDLLESIQNMIPTGVECIYVRQAEPLGLGHAILCARQVVGDHPFAVLLADDLIDSPLNPCLVQMMRLFQQYKASVVGVEKIKREDSQKYGVIKVDDKWSEKGPITGIIEKPQPQKAPSSYGVAGRYILTTAIFDHLENISAGFNGEIQLTDAIARLIKEETVMALRFEGKRYDCGSKLGYMQAMLAYGLNHPEIGEAFRQHILQMLDKRTQTVTQMKEVLR